MGGLLRELFPEPHQRDAKGASLFTVNIYKGAAAFRPQFGRRSVRDKLHIQNRYL